MGFSAKYGEYNEDLIFDLMTYLFIICRYFKDRVLKLSASENLGVVSSRVKAITLKLVISTSLLDAQHCRENVKNKPQVQLCRQWHTGVPW